jgi:hypothetical protein
MNARVRHFAVASVFWALVGCGESPTPVGPHRISSVSISGPTEMTGPGVVRASVDIQGGAIAYGDTIPTTITTTGPFTAVWVTGHPVWYRVLTITATGPGNGSVTVTAEGVSGSIPISAKQVSFQSISVAYGYVCGIATDERAWCWGANDDGQLGLTTPEDCNGGACQYGGNSGSATPLPVYGNMKFTSIATSGVACYPGFITEVCGHTCALTPDGTPYCWGKGFSAMAPIENSVRLVSLSLTAPSFGDGQSCGLALDGAAYCFAGSLTRIGNAMTFTSLSVGRYHSCGIATDGDVYCWGSNLYGNLGIGSADSQTHANPERATATEKFASVAVGDYSTCALGASGTVYCWGQGYDAAGVSPPTTCPGSTIRCQLTPRPIEGGGAYVALSRGDNASKLCGLTSGGQVSCWTAFNRTPSAVSAPEPLGSISVGTVGSSSGCGVSVSHVGYCWGNNYQAFKVGQ